ncbi:MAG: glycoside hydrolase family 15 protein [Verrucomicrobiota bacterium]
MCSKRIENYGIIGDLHTVALVGMDGSIDFMCFPNFDSPTIFAALLDEKNGGYFKLAPTVGEMRQRQLYMPDSAILLTRFLGSAGVAEVSDFMPIQEFGHAHDLVRRAKAVRGEIPFRMELAPRFNYGRSGHRIERQKDGALLISDGPDRTALRLRSSVPLRIENGTVSADFTLRGGSTAWFILEEADGSEASRSCARGYISEAFKETLNFWQSWADRSRYRGRWRETVNRSAMTLKLLTSARYGSLVAAPTFGLPEEPGGARNWDYRYTWIRDASFTIYALMQLGYLDEATAFIRWIEQRCRELEPGNPLQVMYGIDGRHDLPETELDQWQGYMNSRPIRIGNAASKQLQLDIYGELLDAVYLYNQLEPISYDFWQHLVQLVNWVCQNWERPDFGIWEVRGAARPFLYSRVMCWVAIDRGLRLARDRSFPAPWQEWTATRDKIYCNIYQNFWDEELQTFAQFQGAKAVDASALLMPIVKIIGPNDPRWRSTLQVINRRLTDDALVYRYNRLRGADDGLPGGEGTFTVCSFWNVECLAMAGQTKQARVHFEKVLGYANHLGLFAEQIGLQGDQLGNFPQALTHLGLISAARHLDQLLETSS